MRLFLWSSTSHCPHKYTGNCPIILVALENPHKLLSSENIEFTGVSTGVNFKNAIPSWSPLPGALCWWICGAVYQIPDVTLEIGRLLEHLTHISFIIEPACSVNIDSRRSKGITQSLLSCLIYVVCIGLKMCKTGEIKAEISEGTANCFPLCCVFNLTQ